MKYFTIFFYNHFRTSSIILGYLVLGSCVLSYVIEILLHICICRMTLIFQGHLLKIMYDLHCIFSNHCQKFQYLEQCSFFFLVLQFRCTDLHIYFYILLLLIHLVYQFYYFGSIIQLDRIITTWVIFACLGLLCLSSIFCFHMNTKIVFFSISLNISIRIFMERALIPSFLYDRNHRDARV